VDDQNITNVGRAAGERPVNEKGAAVPKSFDANAGAQWSSKREEG
jgi:hypothetical protein